MTPAEHAPLAPSFADVWGYCSGAVAAALAVPERETDATRRGTAGHWVGSEVLAAWRTAGGGCPNAGQYVGQTAPNGVVIDQELADGVQVYVDDVLATCQQVGGLSQLLVEQRVSMPQIHAANWGTLDGALVLVEKQTVFLWDLKLGHVDVQPEGCLQLADYLAGICNSHQVGQDWRVVFRIVQPFSYSPRGPVKEWRGRVSDLRADWNLLEMQAAEAMTRPTLSSGKHCRFCPARGRCSAARGASHLLVNHVREAYAIDSMTGSDLQLERRLLLEGLALVKGRLEAIEEDLVHRISGGEAVDGLAVGTKQGRERFTAPLPAVRAMCQQFGVDPVKQDLITPAQARKLVDKELRFAFNEAIKTMSGRPNGGLQLINAADSVGAAVFSKVKEQ